MRTRSLLRYSLAALAVIAATAASPIGASLTKARLRHLATVLWVQPIPRR